MCNLFVGKAHPFVFVKRFLRILFSGGNLFFHANDIVQFADEERINCSSLNDFLFSDSATQQFRNCIDSIVGSDMNVG